MQFLNKFVAVDNAILEKMRSLIAKTRIFRLRRNAPGPLRILASIVFVLFLTLPITVMDYLKDRYYITVEQFEVLFGVYMVILIVITIIIPITVIIKKTRKS